MKLTEALSIYAACLSNIVFLWNVNRALPRLKIDIVYGLQEIIDDHVPGIYITVRNPSSQTVHLAGVELLYPYEELSLYKNIVWLMKYRRFPVSAGWVHTGLSIYDIDDQCPLALEPGKAHHVFVPQKILNKIAEDSIRPSIKASVQDQLWRNKYSKEFIYEDEKA